MEKGTQVEVPLSEVLDKVIAEVGESSLSFYHPTRDFIIEEPIIVVEEEVITSTVILP